MKDYYAILQVSPDAYQKEIREAYRFLLQGFHPDKQANPSYKARAAEKTKEITEAYAVLGDRMKRAAYDRGRPAPPPSRAEQAEQAEREGRKRAADEKRRKGEVDTAFISWLFVFFFLLLDFLFST